MHAVTTSVRVQLPAPGSLGFSLAPDAAGSIRVTTVERDGPNAAALAGVRAGNELVEVLGNRVAGVPLMDIVPLLQTEERPLSLVFEAQLFAAPPETSSGLGMGASRTPPASPSHVYGTGGSASAHLRAATTAISVARSTPPRSAQRAAREPGSKRIGQRAEQPRMPPELSPGPPPIHGSLLPPPPPPSTAAPATGRYAAPPAAVVVPMATAPSAEAIARLRKLFDTADNDNSGDVSKVSTQAILRLLVTYRSSLSSFACVLQIELILGLRKDPDLCLQLGMTPPRGDEARQAFESLFEGIDKDGDNMVSFPELEAFVTGKFPAMQAAQVAKDLQAAEEVAAAEAAAMAVVAAPPGVSAGGMRQRRVPEVRFPGNSR